VAAEKSLLFDKNADKPADNHNHCVGSECGHPALAIAILSIPSSPAGRSGKDKNLGD
jgi:hypothetical protein